MSLPIAKMMNIPSILKEHYNVEIHDWKVLDGYASQNFLVRGNNKSYILKIEPYTRESEEQIVREHRILQHAQETESVDIPNSVLTNSGQDYLITTIGKDKVLVRMLDFLEGVMLADSVQDDALLKSFGNALGEMNLVLAAVDRSIMSSREYVWDLYHFPMIRKMIPNVREARIRSIIEYFFDQYQIHVEPHRYTLRKAIIHNDANDRNVLVKDGKISGIIDFGDMANSWVVGDLAIALAYVIMGKEDPLHVASLVIRSFNEVFPLKRDECEVLYYLIAARLCTSLCSTATHRARGTITAYIAVNEKDALKMLLRWIEISPVKAKNCFLEAIGVQKEERPSIDKLIKKRGKHISRALSLSYDLPIDMANGAFQYMYDSQGNSILDAYNNIIHVGHCHPKVVRAGSLAMAKLNTNTRYIYPELYAYSSQLLVRFPDHLNKVFFVNSGSAASDLALRLARTHTGNQNVVVHKHGYHGNTIGVIDISHYKYGSKGGEGKKSNVIEAAMPDEYRGEFAGGPDVANDYVGKLKEQLDSEKSIGAFISEPILGCGGQVPLPPGYLNQVYPLIRDKGGVCISDEVQVGFGRLGKFFWGYEMQEVVPDIVILGKPIGNGHPMGAVVTTEEIAQNFDNGMEFFSSFGGNPVSCAIGKAVLDVIEDEKLDEKAEVTGSYIREGFHQLAEQFEEIGDIRGMGMFIGIDMVTDRKTKKEHTSLAKFLKNGLRNKNVLISTDGPANNVLKIKPPLCFDLGNADELLEKTELLLTTYHQESR